MFPGLFYTALSRATTIGSPPYRRNSAMFFENLSIDRLRRLTKTESGTTYSFVARRTRWTDYLSSHIVTDSQDDDIEHKQYCAAIAKRMYTIQMIEDRICDR
jgi:hypothetical protein